MINRFKKITLKCLCFTFCGLFSVLEMETVPAAEDIDRFDLSAASGFTTVTMNEVEAAFSGGNADTRLLFTPERIAQAREKIASDPVWGTLYAAIEQNADALLDIPPLERTFEGIRLLAVELEVVHRIFVLSFCAVIHPEKTEYTERALAEMRAIAQFSDWNPGHFLDVGETTAAMAIGYDALRNQMSEEDQNLIADAILKKGLLSTQNKDFLWWMTNGANWNQVCHTGLALGALAIADREPELAKKIIRRSVNGITYSMTAYEPDGTYTEGPGYWAYGTRFNILLLTALKNRLGTDFGLSDSLGFSKTIYYFESVFGPTGLAWNYPDSRSGVIFEPAAFYFAEKLNDKNLNYNEYRLLTGRFNQNAPEQRIFAFASFAETQFAPMAFLFDTGPVQNPPIAPKENGYAGTGNRLSPIAVFRTGWEPDSAWFGIKGGTASCSHGHMDAGSFVYERYGFRWASDLGPENYYQIESRGMSLWTMTQDSDRWKIYRYNNFSHNTLVINGEKMRVNGNAPIVETSIGREGGDSYAVIDLTPVYTGTVQNARRKGTLRSDGTLEITDTLTALADQDAQVVWRILTLGTPENGPDGTVRLSNKNGDKQASIDLVPRLDGIDQPIQWKWSEAKSDNEWDSPNEGMTDLNFTFVIPAGETVTVTVEFR